MNTNKGQEKMAAKTKTDPFETSPFEDEPGQNDTGGDEAQADINSGARGVATNPLIVAAPSEGKVTVTLKGGTGYNAPWVVIHGSTVTDALNQINDADLAALLERAQRATTYFAAKADTPTPTTAAQGASQTQSGQPAASVAGQGGAVKTCVHGTMVVRAGVKNGKAWSGHFCPTPQGTPDQCRPQFDR